jgi:predicted RNA-binding protein
MTQGSNLHNHIQNFIRNFMINLYYQLVITQEENFIHRPDITVIKLLENFIQFAELIIDYLE